MEIIKEVKKNLQTRFYKFDTSFYKLINRYNNSVKCVEKMYCLNGDIVNIEGYQLCKL